MEELLRWLDSSGDGAVFLAAFSGFSVAVDENLVKNRMMREPFLGVSWDDILGGICWETTLRRSVSAVVGGETGLSLWWMPEIRA